MDISKLIPGWVKTATTNIISKINWKTTRIITDNDRKQIQELLTPDYYIILTRHCGYGSSYLISFSHWVLSGFKNWGYYAHALMNLEDEVKSPNDFRLVEATFTYGVVYSSFDRVFSPQCSGVALLKPKSLSVEQWTDIMDNAMNQVGKPYDTLFDLASDQSLSCVEMVRNALRVIPTYDTDFAHFEEMISKRKNLTPHMFYECKDFEIAFEVRH